MTGYVYFTHFFDLFLQFLYSPVLTLPSTGFLASFGIAQSHPNFTAPGIFPDAHRICTHLGVISHFSAISLIVTYPSIIIHLKKHCHYWQCNQRITGYHFTGPIVLYHRLSSTLPHISYYILFGEVCQRVIVNSLYFFIRFSLFFVLIFYYN